MAMACILCHLIFSPGDCRGDVFPDQLSDRWTWRRLSWGGGGSNSDLDEDLRFVRVILC